MIKNIKDKNLSDLKVAIVHDWLWRMNGGEKCVEAFCEIFPQAEIFTLFGDPGGISNTISSRKIRYSFLQKLPWIKKYYRYTYPLWPTAIETFDFNGFDLVISSSASISKGVVTPYDSLHICYMHTPMRYAWEQSGEYFNEKNFSWWKRIVIPFFLNYLRMWDFVSASRIDKLIVNSKFVANRVRKYYRREPDVIINPPVDIGNCYISEESGNYFVAMAPFEPNKGGRLMAEAARKLGFRLKIIGNGSLRKEIEESCKGFVNIEFLGFVTDKEKFKVLSEAKAFLFFGVEDFGISPVEAMACGVPVIAHKKGGILESLIEDKTGVFFEEESVDAVKDALERFEKLSKDGDLDKKFIRNHALKYSKENFKAKIEKFVVDSLKG